MHLLAVFDHHGVQMFSQLVRLAHGGVQVVDRGRELAAGGFEIGERLVDMRPSVLQHPVGVSQHGVEMLTVLPANNFVQVFDQLVDVVRKDEEAVVQVIDEFIAIYSNIVYIANYVGQLDDFNRRDLAARGKQRCIARARGYFQVVFAQEPQG